MKLWSRGLGRTEVSMDFRYYKVIPDDDSGNVTVIGNMQEPVNWEFTLKMEPDDIAGVMKLVFTVTMLKFVIKNLYRYVVYLFNRKQFVLESNEDLEERVMATYEKMTSPAVSRQRRRPGAGRNSDETPTATPPIAA